MSEAYTKDLKTKATSLMTLPKAPSQFNILIHLISTGKPSTLKEISAQLSLTYKATERAVAKLLEKGLVQRIPFKEGAYTCDLKQVVLSLLLTVIDLNALLEKSRNTPINEESAL